MPTYHDLDNLDHDEEIANALGNMLVVWASAEAMLSYYLAQVFNINPQYGN